MTYRIRYKDALGVETVSMVESVDAAAKIMNWHQHATAEVCGAEAFVALAAAMQQGPRPCEVCGGTCTGGCDCGSGTWPERQEAERSGRTVSEVRDAFAEFLLGCADDCVEGR